MEGCVPNSTQYWDVHIEQVSGNNFLIRVINQFVMLCFVSSRGTPLFMNCAAFLRLGAVHFMMLVYIELLPSPGLYFANICLTSTSLASVNSCAQIFSVNVGLPCWGPIASSVPDMFYMLYQAFREGFIFIMIMNILIILIISIILIIDLYTRAQNNIP